MEAKKRVLKQPSPISRPIKRVTNLKDYKNTKNENQLCEPSSKKPKRVSKMQQSVQTYIRKSKHMPEEEAKRLDNEKEDIDYSEDSEDIIFPAEKPENHVPIPYKLHPTHQKKLSTDLMADKDSNISKNEAQTVSKANTSDSYDTISKLYKLNSGKFSDEEEAIDKSIHSNPHTGTESEITINQTFNDDPEFSNRDSDYITQSPFERRKSDMEFDLENEDDEHLETPEPDVSIPEQLENQDTKPNISDFTTPTKPKEVSEKMVSEPISHQFLESEDKNLTQKLLPGKKALVANSSQKIFKTVDMTDDKS
jgi:hypothetical protein